MKKTLFYLIILLTFGVSGIANAVLPDDATIFWGGVTTNTDGSPLTDLGGYKAHCGTVTGAYTITADMGNVTTYKISDNLPGSGTYYCAITAYNASGLESPLSNEVSFVLTRRPSGCTLSVK